LLYSSQAATEWHFCPSTVSIITVTHVFWSALQFSWNAVIQAFPWYMAVLCSFSCSSRVTQSAYPCTSFLYDMFEPFNCPSSMMHVSLVLVPHFCASFQQFLHIQKNCVSDAVLWHCLNLCDHSFELLNSIAIYVEILFSFSWHFWPLIEILLTPTDLTHFLAKPLPESFTMCSPTWVSSVNPLLLLTW